MIHFVYDSDSLLRSIEDCSDEKVQQFIAESDICLGFLPKKGNASVKSMLKVYKLEEHYSTHMKDPAHTELLINCPGAQLMGINTTAFLSRLELYVVEKQWLEGNMFVKGALTAFINLVEDSMAEVLLEWNKQRSSVSESASNNTIKCIKFSKET